MGLVFELWRWALRPGVAATLLAFACAGLLLAAFGFEYLADMHPCPLCVFQRYAHLAVIGIGVAVALGLPARAGLAMMAVASLIGMGIAAFQVGVEWGWYPLPAFCGGLPKAESVEELRRLLANAPPPCDEVLWSLFGISMAGWNALISLGMAGFAILAIVVGRAQRPSGPERV